jgi:hypothetical protein
MEASVKRILAVGILAAIGIAAMAQTCVVTNESLTEIDQRDVFAGEMQNDSGVDILQHRYIVAFLNDNGAVVETQIVDGCLRSLPDGDEDFFSATSRLSAGTTDVALARMANLAEDPKFKVGRVEEGDIAVSVSKVERTAGSLIVEGTVMNNDEDTLEDPAVCVVVWNDDGRVVTTARDTGIADLAQGESEAFALDVAVPDSSTLVNEIDVFADGVEGSRPVEPGAKEDLPVTVIATATPTTTNTPGPSATATPTATPTP